MHLSVNKHAHGDSGVRGMSPSALSSQQIYFGRHVGQVRSQALARRPNWNHNTDPTLPKLNLLGISAVAQTWTSCRNLNSSAGVVKYTVWLCEHRRYQRHCGACWGTVWITTILPPPPPPPPSGAGGAAAAGLLGGFLSINHMLPESIMVSTVPQWQHILHGPPQLFALILPVWPNVCADCPNVFFS